MEEEQLTGIDEFKYLADRKNWRVFNIFFTFTDPDFVTVLADNPDTIFRRISKRLSCSEDDVRFFDDDMRRIEKKDLVDYFGGQYFDNSLSNLYAFIKGTMVFLDPTENDDGVAPRAMVGVVINNQLDYVWFSKESQLINYIIDKLHCNLRSDFVLFDANRKLIKNKSRTRPHTAYIKTPYIIAYKITK